MNATWRARRAHQRVRGQVRRTRSERAERLRVIRVWSAPDKRAAVRRLGPCKDSDCPIYICPGNGESECPRHGGFGNCCSHRDCPGNYLYMASQRRADRRS